MLQSAHAFAKVFVIDQNRKIVQGTLDMKDKITLVKKLKKCHRELFSLNASEKKSNRNLWKISDELRNFVIEGVACQPP